MAKVHFLLKAPKSKERTLIVVVYRIKASRVMRSTREFIAPHDWDFKTELPVPRRNRADLAELRNRIVMLRLEIEAQLIRLRTDNVEENTVTVGYVFDRALNRVHTIEYPTVDEFVRRQMMPQLRAESVHLLKYFITSLEKFASKVRVDALNVEFFEEYALYLLQKQYRQNTIRNYLSALKRVVRAVERKYKEIHLYPSDMRLPSFEKAHKLALTTEELVMMHQYPDYDDKQREAVDLFLIMSFVGIRRKDAQSSRDVNFADGEFYVIDTSKSGQRVVVPQHWVVKEILQRAGGFRVPAQSMELLLQRVREAAKMCGIKGMFFYTITRGKKKVKYEVPRVEAITWHTARRSFATNLHKAGIPAKVAMQLTGHKTIQQYMDYIMISTNENAEQYASHSFFTNKN